MVHQLYYAVMVFIRLRTDFGEYKYGQQEQVTVRNHNRSTALERSGVGRSQPLTPRGKEKGQKLTHAK